jgi:transposase
LLFVLSQEVEMYRMYQDKIGECDRELQEHLKQMVSKVDLKRQPLGPRPKGKKAKRNTPRFDLRTELYRITGVDWAQVNGIDVNVAQTVIAEVGVDPREFPSERNFASWLGLSPAN